MGVKRLGEGDYILYLEECPNCGTDRKLDKDRINNVVKSFRFGLTIASSIAFIGILPVLLIGTVSAILAKDYIVKYYDQLLKLNDTNIYTCPKCNNTQLVKALEDTANSNINSSISINQQKSLKVVNSVQEKNVVRTEQTYSPRIASKIGHIIKHLKSLKIICEYSQFYNLLELEILKTSSLSVEEVDFILQELVDKKIINPFVRRKNGELYPEIEQTTINNKNGQRLLEPFRIDENKKSEIVKSLTLDIINNKDSMAHMLYNALLESFEEKFKINKNTIKPESNFLHDMGLGSIEASDLIKELLYDFSNGEIVIANNYATNVKNIKNLLDEINYLIFEGDLIYTENFFNARDKNLSNSASKQNANNPDGEEGFNKSSIKNKLNSRIGPAVKQFKKYKIIHYSESNHDVIRSLVENYWGYSQIEIEATMKKLTNKAVMKEFNWDNNNYQAMANELTLEKVKNKNYFANYVFIDICENIEFKKEFESFSNPENISNTILVNSHFVQDINIRKKDVQEFVQSFLLNEYSILAHEDYIKNITTVKDMIDVINYCAFGGNLNTKWKLTSLFWIKKNYMI